MVAWSLLLCTLFAASPSDTMVLREEIRASLQTGSLIFSQGDCLAVKVFTASPYTHVAAVVVKDDMPVVYDAMNGTGVRKLPLDDYLRFMVPSEVQFAHPAKPLSDDAARAFHQHLETQLGKPYRIRHHVTGRRCDGLHCSEYATDALIAAGWMTAKQPPRVSPGSLLHGVIEGDLYVLGERYRVAEAKPAQPVGETWCQWSYRETAECCTATCDQLSRWFLCRCKPAEADSLERVLSRGVE